MPGLKAFWIALIKGSKKSAVAKSVQKEYLDTRKINFVEKNLIHTIQAKCLTKLFNYDIIDFLYFMI